MGKTLASVLKLFTDLHELQKDLEPEMQACLRTFYELGRDKGLSARARRRPSGLIRQIYLVSRSNKAFVYHGERKVRLCLHLRGRMNDGLIRKIAVDMEHAAEWYQADAIRVDLNRRSARYAWALRVLRLALSNKFVRQVSVADRAALQLILEVRPHLVHDSAGILGALIYDRLLRDLEHRISKIVLEWKETMGSMLFEPMIRWRSTGPLRLSWAYVERFFDSQHHPQVRSLEIPGGVTDRWLRRHLPAASPSRRKEVLRFAVPLRKLTREYSRLLVYVGRLKSRIRRALFEEINGSRPVAGAEAI